MPETKKPRICEVLEVEPFQQFGVSGFGEKYFIDYDGEFCAADCACDDGELVFALAEAINHPESIKRKPRWTAEDIEDAKAIRRIWPEAVSVTRKDEDEISVRIRKTFHPGSGLLLYGEGGIFGSLQPGETVTLDEILEAEHGI